MLDHRDHSAAISILDKIIKVLDQNSACAQVTLPTHYGIQIASQLSQWLNRASTTSTHLSAARVSYHPSATASLKSTQVVPLLSKYASQQVTRAWLSKEMSCREIDKRPSQKQTRINPSGLDLPSRRKVPGLAQLLFTREWNVRMIPGLAPR